MREAALFAAIGQSALVIGALLVWRFRGLTKPRSVGLLMAFGAGAVMSAVATDLVAVAYAEAGAGPTASPWRTPRPVPGRPRSESSPAAWATSR